MPRSKALPYFSTGSSKYPGRTSDPIKYLGIPKGAIEHAYELITKESTCFMHNGCLISLRASNKSSTSAADGGPRIYFAWKGVQYNLLAKVVYMLHESILPDNDRQVASHLCGNSSCLNHCIWEMMWENVYREECHIGFLKECPHSPKCILTTDRENIKAKIASHREALGEVDTNVKKRKRQEV
jgi:hypothetical protein